MQYDGDPSLVRTPYQIQGIELFRDCCSSVGVRMMRDCRS